MKATRRHELRENDLAHAIETARDYLGEHGARLGFILVLALAVIVVVSVTMGTRADNIARAWVHKSKLVFDSPDGGKESIEKLRALTNEATDESFILTGLMEQGRQALRLAQQVETPPDTDLNERAREAFEALLERFPDNALAFGLAHSGLATVAENDFAVDADMAHRERAQEHLQAILDNPAVNSMPFYRLASDRLAKLKETFIIVRFASPAEPEPPEPAAQPGTPLMITPTPISVDELPPGLKMITESPPGAVHESPDDVVQDEPVDDGGEDESPEGTGEDVADQP